MYLITSDKNEPGTLQTLPKTPQLDILNETEFLNSTIELDDDAKFAITTEGVINSVINKTTSQNKIEATNLLKDKFLFRQTMARLFDDYNFFNVKVQDFTAIEVKNKMVVKPRKGFFGTGIRYIDKDTDLQKVKEEVLAEISTNSKAFANSEAILSNEDLLVEDYIGGEEYAVDMFYDTDGVPQILNIYYHPEPENPAYIHALYCSSKEIYERISPKSIALFTKLNEILKVKNYVIHAEFKLDGDRLVPIEMNPMRLGGMGLGNMCFYTLGINPYEYIQKGIAPDWDLVWNHEANKDAVYNFLIAYNGVNSDTTVQKPNIDKLKQDLGEVINETHFDYQNNLVFGIFTSKETKESMERLKSIEFDDYFE